MSDVPDRFTVVLDANVLYPFLVRDALLSFAHAGLYRARWTGEIIDEFVGALLESKPGHETKIRQIADIMASEFPEALVENYEVLIPSIDLPDADDRHVLAAALASGAHVIVTANLKDFPSAALAHYDIEARTADEFLQEMFRLYPAEAMQSVRAMRRRFAKPAMSADELLIALKRNGLTKLAAELLPHVAAV